MGDAWGGSWGSSWALSWTRAIVQKRGGAFYPTPEEMRLLRQKRKAYEDKERELQAAIDATIAESYTDAAHPEIKAAKIEALRVEQARTRIDMQDADDMHTALTMYLEYRRRLH